MNYKKYLTQRQIAEIFGYKTTNSFYSSTAHDDILESVNKIVEIVERANRKQMKDMCTKLIGQINDSLTTIY